MKPAVILLLLATTISCTRSKGDRVALPLPACLCYTDTVRHIYTLTPVSDPHGDSTYIDSCGAIRSRYHLDTCSYYEY